ncbi:MAG: chemotaxis protein CheW [Halothiobacillaceae bacterium]
MTDLDTVQENHREETAPLRVLQLRAGLARGDLLLPYAVIAEVTEASLDSLVTEEQPLLGRLAWRGVEVPLFGLDRLVGDPPVAWRRRLPVVIVYALAPDDRLAYYGLALQGVPRSVRLPQRSLEDEQPAAQPMLAFEGRLATDRVVVPDLDALEARLRALLDAGAEDARH